jgi:(S)-mandelate dehydrogenase
VAGPINIGDLRRRARRRLPRVIFDYVDGGAEDEATLRENRAAFGRLAFRPRILAGGDIDTSTKLFGQRVSLPIVVAPTGLNGLLWPEGDLCLARAAARVGAGIAVSTASNASLEEIAGAVDLPRWFQLYPWGGPDFALAMLERAAAADYGALVVTVDSLVPGNRERDRRHGFAHKVRLSPRIVLDGLAHPRWLARVWLRGGMPRMENLAAFLPDGATANDMADFSRRQRNPGFSWEDLARIRRHWNGALVLKGVLAAEDAVRARQIGCDGVVVSNHGGRQLDGAIATVAALPEIADAVGADMTVLLDSGIRRGTDIAKAIALGADAVMVGRAALYGLAAAGEEGATAALATLAEELRRTMRLLGSRDLAAITPDRLYRPPPGP